MKALIDHFREKELVDKGEEGRAWSTRDRYEAYLNSWIEPRWGKEELTAIRAPLVEEWLRNLRQKPRKRKLPQLRWQIGNRNLWRLPARPRFGI